MPHVCGRWAKQRSNEILTAYFNAVGYTAWENIWGIWNGFHPRDGALLKRATAILRHYHPLLSSSNVAWLPHYPLRMASNGGNTTVFASKFAGADQELWLFINTANVDTDAWLDTPAREDHDFFDVYHGIPMQVQKTDSCLVKSCKESWTDTVKVRVEARGLTAVLRTIPGKLPEKDKQFLETMAKLTATPLHNISGVWGPPTTQTLVTDGQKPSALKDMANMIPVFGSKSYDFRIRGTMIEGFSNDDGVLDVWEGVDVQYPWETVPTKYHAKHLIEVGDLLVDKFPVTNKAFEKFLKEANYTPQDSGHFLRHWGNDGCIGALDCKMPAGVEQQPVVNVGLPDARSYCAYFGKRLPHEWEWQYVAQGGNPDKAYPWGNEWDAKRMPAVHGDASTYTMTNVGQSPSGASKDGIEDLLGLVYHWTDEYTDAHTRRAVLRGAPAFQPQLWREARWQPWYFPGLDGDWKDGAPWDKPYTVEAKQYASLFNLTAHGNYLLMTPSLDRAGTVGFRCVADSDSQTQHI